MNRAAAALGFAFLAMTFAMAAPEENQTGPRYEFSDSNSPGVVLELKETGREKKGKPTFVHYHLDARGFTPGKTLNLYQWGWSTENGTLSQSGFKVDDAGQVACTQPQPGAEGETPETQCKLPLDKLVLNASGYLRGQVFMLGLVSTDGEERGFVDTIPFPIVAQHHGCRLEARCLSLRADTWLIEGEGFKPSEGIRYVLKGPLGKYEGSTKLKETGKLAFTLSPPDRGITGDVTLTVEASACKPVLRFKWGISALEYP